MIQKAVILSNAKDLKDSSQAQNDSFFLISPQQQGVRKQLIQANLLSIFRQRQPTLP